MPSSLQVENPPVENSCLNQQKLCLTHYLVLAAQPATSQLVPQLGNQLTLARFNWLYRPVTDQLWPAKTSSETQLVLGFTGNGEVSRRSHAGTVTHKRAGQ